MTLHPEELRVANSLRELIFELGMTTEEIEGDLGWEVERLSILLAGRKRWRLGELFEVLQALDLAPAAFFGRVYGLDARDAEALALSDLDRPFEESQRVVQEAVSRRFAWKQERMEVEPE
jgi:transcriptional regulator with XRE-family HTH domain